MLKGSTRPRRSPTMKNFSRLVRFAWPYRVRFGLSLICACMVALLWGANISAVYPLLKILFYSQNMQTWVIEKIEVLDADSSMIRARQDELDAIEGLYARPGDLAHHFQIRMAEHKRLADEYDEQVRREAEEAILVGRGLPAEPQGVLTQNDRVDRRPRALKVAWARYDELLTSGKLPEGEEASTLAARRQVLTSELEDATWWLTLYHRLQPYVFRYFPGDGFKTLLVLIGVVISGVALKGLFQFLQEVLVADVMQLTLFDIRNQFFRRTMALDLAHFSKQNSADLMSRFTTDMDSVGQGLITLLGKVIREPLRAISCLSIAMWLNWRLTCLALVLVPVSGYTANRAGQIIRRAMRKSLESMSNVSKILMESFQGIMVVKAFTTERRERRRFFVETKSLYKKSLRVATIDSMSDPVLEMLALSTVSIALMAGSYLVLRRTTTLDLWFFKLQLASQRMAIEDLLYLYATLAGISDPVRKMANVHSRIQRAAAAADRICAMMDRRPEVADVPEAVRLHRHHKGIEFDRIGFSYDGRDPVIRDLSLSVRHGETIALVGPNGCGKSTLMNLLPRFYEVGSGAIRVDGHDIRDVQIRSLRGQIGMVIQETILFEDTVANNIAYGCRHATRDEVIVAAKRSYAHQFISSLPEGYDTMIGPRGQGLSGGQRQRIALARAMLRDPAILILDEATSAVDIQDEALIRKAIEEFARGRTTFLITHSLGSLQFADRIVLMNSGRIEAVGTESELRRSSPLFRKLHEIHFHRESA